MQGCQDQPGLAEVERLFGRGVVREYDLDDCGDQPRFWQMWHKRQAEVVLVIRRPGDRVLLHTKQFYPPAAYRLPSGGIDQGEELLAAVRREMLEETGLEARIERYLGVLCYRFRRAGQLLERASFVFVLDGGAGPLGPQDESEQITDFREVPTGELAEVARNLENQPGEWAVWGGFRALVHRFVAQELMRDA